MRGMVTCRITSSAAAAIGIASSAPVDAEQGAADEYGDDGDGGGYVDRPAHDTRVDDVVLELLVGDVEDDAGDAHAR